MAGTPPLFVGYPTGVLIPQEGAYFTNTNYGFDTGTRKFLTRKETPESRYPQIGDPDATYKKMYVVDVIPRATEATDLELEVIYKGITRTKPDKLHPGCDAQIMTLATELSGVKRKTIVTVPVPRLTRTYIATAAPDLSGVGSGSGAGFLPGAPSWSVTYFPDPDEPPTYNLLTGWVLQSREWDDAAGKIWEVTEHFAYFYQIAT